MSIQFNDEPEGDGVSAGPKNDELTNSANFDSSSAQGAGRPLVLKLISLRV